MMTAVNRRRNPRAHDGGLYVVAPGSAPAVPDVVFGDVDADEVVETAATAFAASAGRDPADAGVITVTPDNRALLADHGSALGQLLG